MIFHSNLLQIIWMRTFLQFVFKWLQFRGTKRTLCRWVTTRALPVCRGEPEIFANLGPDGIFKIACVVKCVKSNKWLNLGSVEEMRCEDPVQDLQTRLENPVPSSVPSEHLFFFKACFLLLFCNLGHWQSTSASSRSLRRKRLHLALSTWWGRAMKC